MKNAGRWIVKLLVLSLLAGMVSACAGSPAAQNAAPAAPAPDAPEAPASEAAAQAPEAAPAPATEVDPVRIAAFYNLSGSGADNGNNSLRGAQLAAEYINSTGGIKSLGGAMIEIVPADTMSDTSQAKAVADRILADKTILAGIGVASSGTGIPMLPSFERAGVPFVMNGTANEITSQGYQTVFQFCCTSTAYGGAQVNYIQHLNSLGYNITKFGALFEDSEAGVTTTQTNKEKIAEAGFEWVYEDSFTMGALTDASSIAVAMKQSGVQVVFITARDSDTKIILDGLRTIDYMPLIFGAGAGFLTPPFAQELGDNVEGVISVASANWDLPAVTEQGDGWDTAAKDFQDRHGIFMPEHATGGYSTTRMVAAALEACGSRELADIRDAIRALDMSIFNGHVNFDETGTNLGAEVFVIQWQKDSDGVFRPRSIYPEELAASELQVETLSIQKQ